jgi:serine/threonine protein kinase
MPGENLDNRVGEAQKQATPVSSADETRISASPELPDTQKIDIYQLKNQVIGGVLLEKGISKGGMSIVYEGTHLKSKKKVILKILNPKHVDENEMVERFLDDARTRKELEKTATAEMPFSLNIIRNISSGIENVVNIATKSEQRSIPYIIDEFVPNAQDLTKSKLTVEQYAAVISQVAEALKYMHNRESPVIHRDIKPANIIVDNLLHAYLIDFGSQKTLDDRSEKPSLTVHGQVMGTLDFLAPEQAKSAKDVVPESDLYSLACTMYSIHSRRPPKEKRTTNQLAEVQISNGVTHRMNLQVPYDAWLNDAIGLKREELAEKLNSPDAAVQQNSKEQLGRIVPVSWQYERLVMMVLEAKDPKDRPPLSVWSDKLDGLINGNLLIPREITADKKSALDAQEKMSDTFKKAPVEVQDDVKNKYEQAKRLETLIDWTVDDEKRAVYLKEAFDAYNAVHVGHRIIKELKIDLKTLEDKMLWLKSCQHYENALKKRREVQQAQKETPMLIDLVRKYLKEEKYGDVCETYIKIDPARVPENFKPEFNKLTEELIRAIRGELDTCKTEPHDPETKRYKRAFSLSQVLQSSEVKKEVEDFYSHHIQEREFNKLHEEYISAAAKKNYFTMLERSAGMEKCIENLPEDKKQTAKALVEGYQNDLKPRKDDVTFLRGLIESTDGMQAEFAKEVTDAGIPEERIKYYRDGIDDKVKKLQSINAENVGPKYDDFKAYVGFFQEDVRVQELKRGVAMDTFSDRMSSLTELINIYHNRNDAGSEKLYILVQKKQLETRLGELDKK